MIQKKTKKFLWISSLCLGMLCIVVFTLVGRFMSGKSETAISEIGTIYMSEMSGQLQREFEIVIDLRLLQLEGIIRRTPPDSVEYGENMKELLALSAEVRNFTFLALYTEDEECEIICGEPVEFLNDGEFSRALHAEGKSVTSGFDSNGQKLLFLEMEAEYPMADGRTSCAIVAGLPMISINEALGLETEEVMVYAHVICKDGEFVLESGETGDDNYFAYIRKKFQEFDGKQPERYIEEIKAAMDAQESYSALTMVDGVHQHLYCSPLSNSEWYLVSIMPYGTLDDAVNRLGKQRQYTILGGCSIILAAVLVIFILYYRISQQQMKELDKAEKAAVRANRAKSEFLSNMSHDIRTPMNGIAGMTAIAMANAGDSAKVQDCLTKIALSSKHLLGLINDVLDMAKIESGKLTLNMNRISLRETMDNLVNIMQPQIKDKHQHFDIFIHNIQYEEVYCDSVRLNQILINLLSNAVKFTHEGGNIRVYLDQEPSPVDDKHIRCHFKVRDNGIGMTKEFQKQIFDTFTRDQNAHVEKTEGTGLGMAITKCIVDAMGGTIELESEPGLGSEFHVILDLEKVLQQEEDMKLPPWKMLVVDNNEDLCRSAAASLAEIGVDAQWALDGKAAVQMAEARHQQKDDYEIVLLDWKMPEMDGLQTAKALRAHLGQEVPILIISAYDWGDVKKEAMEAGIQGFISKPLFKSNLYAELRRYMPGASGQERAEETGRRSFEGKRILLAEDNDLNWEIAEDILSECGFELERAENGLICTEKFKASAAGYYDIILMDIRMPVMNGYEAAQRIRAMDRKDADLPIIAMTADAFSEDIQRSLDSGMNAHISKPIDENRLVQLLNQYVK